MASAHLLLQETLAACQRCCCSNLLHCLLCLALGHHGLGHVQVQVDGPLRQTAPATARGAQSQIGLRFACSGQVCLPPSLPTSCSWEAGPAPCCSPGRVLAVSMATGCPRNGCM